MNNKKNHLSTNILIVVCAILLSSAVIQPKAQTSKITDPFGTTKLTYIPFHFAPFPFDSVIVLDSRKDTSCIAFNENGDYPPEILNFIEPATDAIRNYIKTSGKRKANGLEKSILINLKHLRVLNKNFIYRKEITPDGRLNNFLLRTYGRLELSADIYLQTRENKYRKFVSVNRAYTSQTIFDKACLKRVIDEMMDAITLFYSDSISPKPKEPYRFKREIALRKEYVKLKDTTEMTIIDIDRNTKNEYSTYSILKDTMNGYGVYLTFEDLRDNSTTKIPFSLINNSIDSGYTLEADMNNSAFKNHYPYALLDSGKLFIKVYDDKYVELKRSRNELYFDVPKLLPNMYAILSDERVDLEKERYGYDYLRGKGLIGASIIVGAEAFNNVKFHKLAKSTAASGEFRHCRIDLFDGDFIY